MRGVCLSFVLFKLLRRVLEQLPAVSTEEVRDCRRLLMEDLDPNSETLFQVMMADEVKFVTEYYQSVVPVVIASPTFVLVNYFVAPVAVLGLCLIALAACGNRDVRYALGRISGDNYSRQPGFAKLAICTLARAAHSRPAFFFVLDLSITFVLFVIFLLEEIWELLPVLLSNWFVISMVHGYMTTKHRHQQWRRWCFRWTLWLRCKMSEYTSRIRLKQFSLVSNHRPPFFKLIPALLYFNITSVPATQELKRSIMDCLVEHDRYATPLTNGRTPLIRHGLVDEMLWACDSDSVTEVILTWHVATCLLATLLPPRSRRTLDYTVPVSLSRYCGYLVAFHPELLPDRQAKTELVFEDAKQELRGMHGFWGYYLGSPGARVRRLMEIAQLPWDDDQGQITEVETSTAAGARLSHDRDPVVLKGAKLAKVLYSVARERGDETFWVWNFLTDVWTELIVYAAPGPATNIRVQGVELITVLSSFATHTGLSRPRRGNHSATTE